MQEGRASGVIGHGRCAAWIRSEQRRLDGLPVQRRLTPKREPPTHLGV